MLFSVLIPSYNRFNFLQITIPLLIQQIINIGNGEILIVNDGSTDQTQILLEKYNSEYPDVFRFINNNENNGITKTRNILVNEAKGKYLIFIDSDVFPSEKLIFNHLKVLSENKKVICQGNLILFYQLNFDKSGNFIFPDKKPNPTTDYSRAFFDTANVSVEKEFIVQAGYFDEKFSGYGWEDLELGIRLKKLGLKVIHDKKNYAYHYHEKVVLKNIDNYLSKEKARAKGSIYFSKKHNTIEVKLITQLTSLHLLIDYLTDKLFGIEKGRFMINLNKAEKKSYDKFIPLFRIYLNHFYMKELKALIKQK